MGEMQEIGEAMGQARDAQDRRAFKLMRGSARELLKHHDVPDRVADILEKEAIYTTQTMVDLDDSMIDELGLKLGEKIKLKQAIIFAKKHLRNPPRERLGPLLLGPSGPEREAAIQGELDTWHADRWVVEGPELGRGGSGAVFRSTDSRLGEKHTRNLAPYACDSLF